MILTRRPACDADIGFAREVHHRAYRDVVVRTYGPWDEAAQDRFFNEDWRGHKFEIVLCDGVACGYLSLEERPETIGVREIVIAPEFQGRGIGSGILKEVIALAKESGRRVALVTQLGNRAANLYRRLGFRETGKTATHFQMEWAAQSSHGRRIILAGGGDAEDSVKVDRIFAGWTGKGPMLYLPVAMDRDAAGYEKCRQWIHEVFEPLGASSIVMSTELTRVLAGELSEFSSIYIGGGNTYRLLDLMRRTGFEAALRNFIENGGAVYGGSAGAIVLGRDIGTCAHLDRNEVGISDTRGLGCAANFSVWCHYLANDRNQIEGYMRAQAGPVIAMPEKSGLVIEGESATVEGDAPVEIYEEGTIVTAEPGAKFQIAATPINPNNPTDSV